MLNSSEAALVAHGRARLFSHVPAQLHHFLCLSHVLGIADTWLYLHFQLLSIFAFLGLDVTTSFLLNPTLSSPF